MKKTALKYITSFMFLSVVLVGLSFSSAQASSLYSGVLVSDAATVGNTISQGNTSRTLGVAPDGKIYVVYHGTNGIRVAKSTDRGQTFSPSVRITTGNFETEINVSSNGNVYVAWVESGSARISVSTDGGLTFSTPKVIGGASTSIHMATDSEYVYIIERNGNRFYSSNNNGSTFTSFAFNSSYAFSDVHVNPVSREVIVQKDNPNIVYSISSNHGVSFGPVVTPGASIYYSVGAVSAGPNGNFLFISGSATAAARINLDTKAVTNLTFGNSTTSQGRSLSADGFGNVVTGYAKNADVYYAISNNLGTTFGPETKVATATVANAAINKTNGDIMFAYEASGKIYLSVFASELTGYTPTLSTASLTFSGQEINTSSTSQVVTMTNTGVAPLLINSITTTGNFSVTSACGTSLAAGSTCDVVVTFNPLSVGANAGAINISTNASTNARVISLTGTGVDSLFPVSSILVSEATGLDGWYLNDATFTLSATDIGSGVKHIEYSLNNGTTWTKYVQPVVITASNTVLYRAVDEAGNIETSQTKIFKIDQSVPTATVAYNTTTPTNQDVVATITASEDVTITNNGGSNGHSFSENGSFTFNFVDAAGNTGLITATVTNIDKVVPTATVAYDSTAPTNQDVVATITASEDVTITNNGGSSSYTFTENGSFTFEFIDATGNTGSVTATVANIDRIAPTATVAFNKTTPTNQDVVATITANELVTITNNGGSSSYTFTDNGSFTFEFIDAAGNIGSDTATVANIDRIAPTATVAYNTTAPTNQDVVATLTASEDVTITNNGGSNGHSFSENGSLTFNFVDAAGNTGSITATVTNIDKVAPTATVAYNTTASTNQDVVATITASEAITITNNGGLTSYTFTQNGSFTFTFVDAVGNTGSVVVTVANIDKVAPTATVAYNTTAPTNQVVVATITANEAITITNNGGSTSYTFTQNGSFTFNFVDAAGNTGSVIATVTNIDKIAPTLVIKLDNPVLNPPNHKMVDIHVTLTSQDNNAGPISIILKSITSNEPDNGLGDGDTAIDIQGAAIGTLDTDFKLRAERSGKGNGRIYTITYTITDAAGNQTTAIATVLVNKGSSNDNNNNNESDKNKNS
jgi:hypothetical protein